MRYQVVQQCLLGGFNTILVVCRFVANLAAKEIFLVGRVLLGGSYGVPDGC